MTRESDPKVLLTIFFMFQLMVILSVEALIRLGVAPNDYLFRRAELFQTKRTLDGAFGDSHVMRGLTGMPNMTNFGQGSDTIFDMSAKIRHYYANQHNFRIILQASPQQMLQRSIKPSDRTNVYLGRRSVIPLLMFRPYFREQLPLILLSTLTNPQFRNKRIFTDDGAELDDANMSNLPQDEITRAAIKEVVSKEPPADFATSPQADEYRALALFLVRHNADVCLLTTPVSAEYAIAASNRVTFRATRRWFDALAVSYGFKRVDLFENDIPLRFFSNSDHMNVDGARYLGPVVYSACFDKEQKGERIVSRPSGLNH